MADLTLTIGHEDLIDFPTTLCKILITLPK